MATHSSILAWKIPWTEEPGSYSPRGRKESDNTEPLHYNYEPGTALTKHFAHISSFNSQTLLSFCLVDLSIGVSGVLQSPILIVLLLISPFILVSICLTY